MTNRETMELFIEKNGQETVAYPFVEKDHVVFGNGMGIEEVIEQDISMPTVTHEEVSFKVGVGDQDVSSSVVDSSVGEMVIKGQTYHNILPEPSTHVLTNNKEMFKVNEGLDPNVEIVDGVSKSAILTGQTLVNLASEKKDFSGNVGGNGFIDFMINQNLKANTTYTAIFKVETDAELLRVGITSTTSSWNSNQVAYVNGNNKILLTTTTETTYSLRIRYNDTTTKSLVVTNAMLIEGDYTNEDIPYFEGMQSVKMPVLTTTNCLNLFTKDNTVDDGGQDVFGDFVEAKKNDKFSFNEKYGYESWTSLAIYNVNKEMIYYKYEDSSSIPKTIVLPDDDRIAYVRPRVANNRIDTIMFNRGEVIPYEEYKANKTNILTVNEPIELRGIGEVKDELDLLTGELTQRLINMSNLGDYDMPNYTVHDGTESSSVPVLKFSFNLPFKIVDTGYGATNNFPLVCDKFKIRGDENGYSVDRGSYVSSRNNQLFLHLIKEEVGLPTDKSITKEIVKEFFKENPIEVTSRLVEPVIKTVDLSTSGNWEKIVLDGSENWSKNSNGNVYLLTLNKSHSSLNGAVLPSMTTVGDYEIFPYNTIYNAKAEKGIGLATNGNQIGIRDVDIANVDELKAQLQSNPITVWYQTITTQDSTQVKQPIFFKDGHIIQSSGADNSLIPTLDYQAKTSNSYVMDLMKTNTKYTMKAKSASGTFTIDGTSYGAGTNGTFTTPSSMTNKLLVMSNKTNEEVMIIEGDVTDKTIPYFKGIKSAFEGEDKIEVLSTGKNLFDKNKVLYGKSTSGNGELIDSPPYVTSDLISVKPNTNYTVKHLVVVSMYDKNGSYIGGLNANHEQRTFTTPSNCSYIRIRNWGLLDTVELQKEVLKKTVLQEGDSIETYEPYKSNSTKIPLLSPLRSLPNGTCDELIIDRMKKKATLIQRVGHSVINSEFAKNGGKWGNTKDTDPCWGFHCGNYVQGSFKLNEHNSINDKLPIKEMATTGDPLMGYYQSNPHIALRREEVCDMKMALNWLDRNPINFYYQLETPVITEVDLEGFPYIYKDGHIFLNSEIAPNTQITYSISQQHQISASTQDLIRHEQELVYLYKLIAQYIQVDYQSTLLSLDLKLK